MDFRSALRSACLVAGILFLSIPAQAALFRAYVSSTGSDSNPCTIALPCRLLPAALAAAVDGGEVWMLDSANYNTGTVTIGQSVSIVAVPGAVGSLVTAGGPAISITAAGLTVSLHNVAIVPVPGTTANGITMTGASLLMIDKSSIVNVGGAGVEVLGTGTLKLANSTIQNVGLSAVWLLNGASAEISGTRMLVSTSPGTSAVDVESGASTSTTATVSDSILSGFVNGVLALANASGASSKVLLTRSTIEKCSFDGMNSQASNGGTTNISISADMIVNNGAAWFIGGAGSTITSLGNNHISDNAGSSTGSLSPTALQ